MSVMQPIRSADLAVTPRRMADAIRFLSLDAIERAGDGHPGAPLGCAEIATALFIRHLKCNPIDPTWPDRDRFVLSNGHGSMLLYSLLHLSGYQAFYLTRSNGSARWDRTPTAIRNTRPNSASK
jgi:transketolase